MCVAMVLQESDVSMDYLQSLHQKHEDWLVEKSVESVFIACNLSRYIAPPTPSLSLSLLSWQRESQLIDWQDSLLSYVAYIPSSLPQDASWAG